MLQKLDNFPPILEHNSLKRYFIEKKAFIEKKIMINYRIIAIYLNFEFQFLITISFILFLNLTIHF